MSVRVLIADDDAVVRDVVRRYLERDGLEVRVAGDGNEALRVLGSERIDVAVLDVMMPGPNGLSLCRTLRQGRDGVPDYSVPVILLTAISSRRPWAPPAIWVALTRKPGAAIFSCSSLMSASN